MVEVTKEELEVFERKLYELENIINGDLDVDGLETYYSTCSYQYKRLRKLLDRLTMKYGEIYDLFNKWYNRQTKDNDTKERVE